MLGFFTTAIPVASIFGGNLGSWVMGRQLSSSVIFGDKPA